MIENGLRKLWAEGGKAVNAWCGIPSPVATENMAQAGWDSMTVDLQHGLVDYSDMIGMLQAIATRDSVPIVRVPWNEPGIIGKALDAGAMGIICPMVNTEAEAKALADACRYPPHGLRSFGPTRAIWRYGPDYAANANDQIVVMAMIETEQAVSNLDAILSVPGIDAVYIGPADLGLTHGFVPKGDRDEPELLAVIDKILDGCKRHGKFAGIHCGAPEYARGMLDKGFDLATIGADNLLLMNAAKAAVQATKGADGGGSKGGLY